MNFKMLLIEEGKTIFQKIAFSIFLLLLNLNLKDWAKTNSKIVIGPGYISTMLCLYEQMDQVFIEFLPHMMTITP